MNENVISKLSENESEMKELLAVHLQKPEKVEIFADAFKKTVVNGTPNFAATWSWYAFFAGPFYFFYRKMYAVGGIILAAELALGFIIPFLNLGLAIFSGIAAKYFYIKKFANDVQIVGYGTRSDEEVKASLKLLGGFNTWAIVAFFVLMGISIIASISLVIYAAAMATQY